MAQIDIAITLVSLRVYVVDSTTNGIIPACAGITRTNQTIIVASATTTLPKTQKSRGICPGDQPRLFSANSCYNFKRIISIMSARLNMEIAALGSRYYRNAEYVNSLAFNRNQLR